MGYRLGVDLGTTHIAAAVEQGTGATMVELGDRAPTVPSVVFLAPDGTFLFGEAAERAAATDPARSVHELKRHLADTVPIVVAGQPFSPQTLGARVLAWTATVARDQRGAAPDEVVVTCPATWDEAKRDLLQRASSMAVLPGALTCTEPEAAAAQYASHARLSPGDRVAVYDLGGGTFDVCVLEKQDGGFSVLGSPVGVEHLGGVDFDEAVFGHVTSMLSEQLAGLDRANPRVTDGLVRLRRECVAAKEALSTEVEASIAVALPGLTTSLTLTRAELDSLLTSPLRETLEATQRALRSARLTAADLTTVVLVGGSSRIPLVHHLLQSELGVRTAMGTHPENDIALGAVLYQRSVPEGSTPAVSSAVARWPTRGTEAADEAPPPPIPPPPPTRPPDDRVLSPDPGPSEPEPATVIVPMTSGGPVEEEHAEPPVRTPPGEGPLPPDGSLSAPTVDSPGHRLSGRHVLLGIGTVVALLVVGLAACSALNRGGGHQQLVVGHGVILVPLVGKGSTDPVLHQIATDPAQYGADLGPLPRLTGAQQLPSLNRGGTVLEYLRAPPGSGFDRRHGTLMVVTAKGSPVGLFTRSPPHLLCHGRAGWSPDGTQVVLACYDDLNDDGVADSAQPVIYVGPVDSHGRVDGTRLEPRLRSSTPTSTSPSGSPASVISNVGFTQSGQVTVAYERGQWPGLYVVPSQGSPRRLTSHADGDPVASPTSNLIAFTRDGDLYLTSTGGQQVPCPAPRVASTDEVTQTSLCNLTGTATGAPGRLVADPTWSWDGRTIAFRVMDLRTRTSTLYLIDVYRGALNPLNTHAEVMGAPGWGPR